MPVSLVTGPAEEPLSAEDVRAQLRVTSTAEDAFVTARVIPAARERMENATRRQALTATWDLVLDAFPVLRTGREVIELPRPPLQSVTSIQYYDLNGTLQTWSAAEYVVQTFAGPRCRRGVITPAYGYTWPNTQERPGAVRIRFVCGYGASGAAVPPLLLQGMLLDIGGLLEFREELVQSSSAPVVIPRGAASIYGEFRSRARFPLPEGLA